MEKKNIDLKFTEKIRKIKKQKRTIKPEQPESGPCGEELIKLNKKISKEHIKLDFQKLFNEVLVERCGKSWHYISKGSSIHYYHVDKEMKQDFNPYIIIKDSEFGIFRIEDMGENYLIPIQKFNDSIIKALIEHFTENGVICKQVNENYLSISKIKRDFLIG